MLLLSSVRRIRRRARQRFGPSAAEVRLEHPLDPRRARAALEPLDHALALDERERRHRARPGSARPARAARRCRSRSRAGGRAPCGRGAPSGSPCAVLGPSGWRRRRRARTAGSSDIEGVFALQTSTSNPGREPASTLRRAMWEAYRIGLSLGLGLGIGGAALGAGRAAPRAAVVVALVAAAAGAGSATRSAAGTRPWPAGSAARSARWSWRRSVARRRSAAAARAAERRVLVGLAALVLAALALVPSSATSRRSRCPRLAGRCAAGDGRALRRPAQPRAGLTVATAKKLSSS